MHHRYNVHTISSGCRSLFPTQAIPGQVTWKGHLVDVHLNMEQSLSVWSQKEASQPATIEGQFVPKRPISSLHSATGLEFSRNGAHDPTLGFPGMLYRTINNWKGTSPRQTKLVCVASACLSQSSTHIIGMYLRTTRKSSSRTEWMTRAPTYSWNK